MNEDLVLQMAEPYIENGKMTYRDFEKLYDMLSLYEQYDVVEILYDHGIELYDDSSSEEIEVDEEPIEELELADNLESEDFQILYDENLFQTDTIDEEDVVVNKDIRQTNNILCALIQSGNKQAVQDLCVKNKALVDKYASAYQKFYNHKLDFEDLEQAGFLGLLKAAKRFDLSRGYAFSTYAIWWIKQSITREIMDHGFTIRIPVHMMEKIAKVNRLQGKYSQLDQEERIAAIASEMETSQESVRFCLVLSKNYIQPSSLNTPIGEEEDSELLEFIPDTEELSADDLVDENELKRVLWKALDTLKPKERDILILRFGLDEGGTRTLEEIGQQYGVTRERIRQIEEKAIRKLKHPSKAKQLKDFYK